MTTDLPDAPEVITLPPDISSAYGNGWRQLWKHFWDLLLAGIIFVAVMWGSSWLISLPFSVSMWNMDYTAETAFTGTNEYWLGGYGIISLLLALFVHYPLMTGMGYLFLSAARGQSVEIKDLFIAFRNYLNVILAYLIMFAAYLVPAFLIAFLFSTITALGVIFLICWVVVGIILTCKLALVPLLLVDKKMKTIEAIKTSWNWTHGYTGNVFLMGLLAFPIAVAGFFCLIIGVIPAYMWIYTSFASLYHAIRLQKDTGEELEPVLLDEPSE